MHTRTTQQIKCRDTRTAHRYTGRWRLPRAAACRRSGSDAPSGARSTANVRWLLAMGASRCHHPAPVVNASSADRTTTVVQRLAVFRVATANDLLSHFRCSIPTGSRVSKPPTSTVISSSTFAAIARCLGSTPDPCHDSADCPEILDARGAYDLAVHAHLESHHGLTTTGLTPGINDDTEHRPLHAVARLRSPFHTLGRTWSPPRSPFRRMGT